MRDHEYGGQMFPDGGTRPIPLFPGFPRLFLASSLICLGLWLIPAKDSPPVRTPKPPPDPASTT